MPQTLSCVIEFTSQPLLLKNIISRLQAESSDFITYGLIPEFIGRFPILVSLSALTEDQLVQVFLFSVLPSFFIFLGVFLF